MSFSRFWIAMCFYVHLNVYFGWNAGPKSPEECIADGIFLLLLSLSFKQKTVAA